MPDGRSLISSVGEVQTAIWLHEGDRERQITSEESATWPSFSHDGKMLYYLSGRSREMPSGELRRVNLADGRQEQMLPGINATLYDISADDKQAVYAANDASGHSRLWIARLDHRTAPRQLPGRDIHQPGFLPNGDVVFLGQEGKLNYLFRSGPDGSGLLKVSQRPVLGFQGLSPDGQWAVVWAPVPGDADEVTKAIFAFPIRGGDPIRLCNACGVRWSMDLKFAYVVLDGNCFRVPVAPPKALPAISAGGIESLAALKAIPGATALATPGMGTYTVGSFRVVAGPERSTYAFTKYTVHRNLYRIPLP
jgi:hypothetical protein